MPGFALRRCDPRNNPEGSPLFLCLKLPRSIRGTSVRLKRLAVTDGPFLTELAARVVPQPGQARGGLSFAYPFRLWWRMRRRYTCCYIIRRDGRPIGVVGLYALDPGRTAEITLVIGEEGDRGKGYGTESFGLFMSRLSAGRPVEAVLVRLAQPDARALTFWRRLGFFDWTGGPDLLTLGRPMSAGR